MTNNSLHIAEVFVRNLFQKYTHRKIVVIAAVKGSSPILRLLLSEFEQIN